jgi:hypothetical protein
LLVLWAFKRWERLHSAHGWLERPTKQAICRSNFDVLNGYDLPWITALHNNLHTSGEALALAALFLPVAFSMVVKVGPNFEGRSWLPPFCFIITPYAA